MSLTGWVTVVPGEQESVSDVARALLHHADSPQDVRTANAGAHFVVAPYVADRYTRPTRKRRASKKEGEDQ